MVQYRIRSVRSVGGPKNFVIEVHTLGMWRVVKTGFRSYNAASEWIAKEKEKMTSNLKKAIQLMGVGTGLSLQEKIAIETLLMPDAMAGVMGGMSKEEAAKTLRFKSVEEATRWAEGVSKKKKAIQLIGR